MIHMPLLSSLCLATSATVYWLDMLSGCDMLDWNEKEMNSGAVSRRMCWFDGGTIDEGDDDGVR